LFQITFICTKPVDSQAAVQRLVETQHRSYETHVRLLFFSQQLQHLQQQQLQERQQQQFWWKKRKIPLVREEQQTWPDQRLAAEKHLSTRQRPHQPQHETKAAPTSARDKGRTNPSSRQRPHQPQQQAGKDQQPPPPHQTGQQQSPPPNGEGAPTPQQQLAKEE